MKQKTVNERVKALRDYLNLTQQEFATKCDLTNTSLSRIENGQADPQTGTLKKIIGKTGVAAEWLLEGKGDLIVTPPATNEEIGDVYKDALYKELKEDKTKWEEKFNNLFANYTELVSRLNLGKLRATSIAARSMKSNKENRVLVVRD